MTDPLLSVVIPVYNEAATLRELVERVADTPYRLQIICVDDGSSDGSWEILQQLQDELPMLEAHRQPENAGKGAALRAGFSHAQGDLVLIQDADLEYDPVDYPVLLEPLLDGRADVCFGSRFLGGPHRVLNFHHYLGNRALTALSNLATNLNLTDMETCYKVFRREVLDGMVLTEDRFGFEPEFTARVAAGGFAVYEVPISYSGRTYDEGKKITWKDGVRALRVIVSTQVRLRLGR
ncbi:MAG: glycosyltransferase family 2 protein [Myxococcota bacterium]|nr:glycosyltransferase family 2 protein [Myxococcota bacterium]